MSARWQARHREAARQEMEGAYQTGCDPHGRSAYFADLLDCALDPLPIGTSSPSSRHEKGVGCGRGWGIWGGGVQEGD